MQHHIHLGEGSHLQHCSSCAQQVIHSGIILMLRVAYLSTALPTAFFTHMSCAPAAMQASPEDASLAAGVSATAAALRQWVDTAGDKEYLLLHARVEASACRCGDRLAGVRPGGARPCHNCCHKSLHHASATFVFITDLHVHAGSVRN
jgi:hypothetical protein